jgi:AcrR family transcriptional regulator
VPDLPDDRRDSILTAAKTQFGRYGFRRTSMEDIAKETGVSRATLYSYFDNKEEIFRCLSEKLHERSLADAAAHLQGEVEDGAGIAARIEGALLSRITPFLEVVAQSTHGSEIYDESNRLCGDIVLESTERFGEMLTAALAAAARAGEIDLKAAGLTAPAAADLIQLSAAGLKHSASEVAVVEKRVRGFVRVFVAGLGG